MITVEWPDATRPNAVPFLVRDVNLLRSHGIHIDVFYFRGARNPWNYVKATLAVRQKLKSSRYDLIHAQWGQSGIPALVSSLPLVTTFRGSDLFGITKEGGGYTWSGRLLRMVSRVVALRSRYLILVSKRMVPYLLLKKNYFILPSAINLTLFVPGSKEVAKKKLKIAPELKVVLFGGDPDRPDKRFYLAKQAVEKVDVEFPVYLLTVSKVSQLEMPTYYQAADVMLLTSKHEGSPNVVKEALACNTPVVSVDVGDVRERIGHLPGCAVCNDDHPATISKALKYALTQAPTNVELRRFVQDLDENVFAERQIDIYKKVLQ